MFKSRIPLQTPIVVKLLLSSALVTFFVGWSFSNEASSEVLTKQNSGYGSKMELKNSQNNQQLAELAKLTHQKVNDYRASLKLTPLKFNDLIGKQAEIHSRNMAQQEVEFSHKGFQGRMDAIANTISYSSAAENVAYNMGHQNPAQTAVVGWIESEGHRKNMVGNYNLTGIGVAVNPDGEYYFTQIFILEN